MTIGLFAGSFDPVTNGHVDIIKRASCLFDMLYVGIFYNKDKKGLFSIEQRQRMLTEALADLKNVQIITAHDVLAVTVAKQVGATHLVRGLRGSEDIDLEARLDFYNHELAPELETVYLMTMLEWKYVSSTHVRELIYFKTDISKYVPESVVKEVEETFGNKDN
ncbi:pantetheine-phosphate adenylyltransferase [Streptococcus orisratti]|nr:pantetheine-phosphate adenylyltransferase [Streptococcus orisratti]